MFAFCLLAFRSLFGFEKKSKLLSFKYSRVRVWSFSNFLEGAEIFKKDERI